MSLRKKWRVTGKFTSDSLLVYWFSHKIGKIHTNKVLKSDQEYFFKECYKFYLFMYELIQ